MFEFSEPEPPSPLLEEKRASCLSSFYPQEVGFAS